MTAMKQCGVSRVSWMKASVWAALVPRLACEIMTPLGVPVVPPVYCRSTASRSAAAGQDQLPLAPATAFQRTTFLP